MSVRYLLLMGLLLALLNPAVSRRPTIAVAASVTIPGSLLDAVRLGAARRGAPLTGGRHLTVVLSLASRDPRGMADTLAALYDRRSPIYHRFLTSRQVSARFGPDPAAVAGLQGWLRSQGLRPRPWRGEPTLTVDGNTAQLQRAFRVGLWRYSLAGGTLFAADRDPLVPAAYADLVRGIVGLSQQPAALLAPRSTRHPGATPRPLSAWSAAHTSLPARTGPGGGYTPAEVAGAYDFSPLYAAGLHGEGTRVALVELASYSQSDIQAYASHFGIALPVINSYAVDGGNGSEPPQVEATLDIEQLTAMAPGTIIDVYNAPNSDGTGVGLLDAYKQITNAGNAQALSVQWVDCEPKSDQMAGFVQAQHLYFSTLAMQGTTVVAATGDAGAFACADQILQPGPLSTQRAINVPASDPYVLAVGASDAAISVHNGVGVLDAETAWSCTTAAATNCFEGGKTQGSGTVGGNSTLFRTGDAFVSDLSWQTGPGVSNSLSTGGRQVPDVVFSGEYGSLQDHEYSIYYQGGWLRGGGTSAAAPLMTALVLLTDQYLHQRGDAAIGWVNRLLYQLGATVQPYPPYHDITRGSNLFYMAGPNWDFATGWGSPDAWNFARDLAAYAGVPMGDATATLSATPAVSATNTPRPTPQPTGTPGASCGGTGIANGSFQTGTLACWSASGTPRPQIGLSTHAAHRFSVQLGSGRVGLGSPSTLSQTFTMPVGLRSPHLHVGFWLARSVHAPARAALPPLLVVADGAGHPVLRLPFLPHRDHAWSGLAVSLPQRSGRLSVALAVPPQPAGAAETLLIDDVHLGP